MLEITCEQPSIDISALSPEDQQLFARLVQYLLEDNKWMLLEEAQRYAYQQVCFESIEELD
jgi:predicted P-loop ATPase